jgi:hypothetical protein
MPLEQPFNNKEEINSEDPIQKIAQDAIKKFEEEKKNNLDNGFNTRTDSAAEKFN